MLPETVETRRKQIEGRKISTTVNVFPLNHLAGPVHDHNLRIEVFPRVSQHGKGCANRSEYNITTFPYSNKL